MIIPPSASADPQAFAFLKANRTEGLNQTPWLLKYTYNHQWKVVGVAHLYKPADISSKKSWVNLFAWEKKIINWQLTVNPDSGYDERKWTKKVDVAMFWL